MKTMFGDDFFGGRGFSPFRLAQVRAPESAFSVVGDILQAVGVSEDDINKLLDKLPKEVTGKYQTRLDACKAMDVTSAKGAACLYQLYQDMKAESEKPKVPAQLPALRPQASGFPILPVAIGGLLAAGLVVFLATR